MRKQRAKVDAGLERVYAMFPALATMRKRRAAFLSGGQAKMLSIAKELISEPFLVLVDEPSYPGVLISVRPVGVLQMVDQEEPDEKILSVPHRNPRFDQIHTIDQVFPHNLREIEHFFTISNELEGKRTEMRGWKGPRDAREAIRKSRERYLEAHPKPRDASK